MGRAVRTVRGTTREAAVLGDISAVFMGGRLSEKAVGLAQGPPASAAFGAISYLLLQFMEAPYGRFEATGSRWFGPRIPGKVAWVLQV